MDLTTCDREPIHLPGAIQSFGFLLSVNADWIIVRASENTRPHTGLDPDQLVGQLAERCMDTDVLHDIRGRLQLASAPGVVERLFGRRLTPGGRLFDIAIHQSGLETIMEFEPSEEQEASALATVRTVFNRLERHVNQQDLCRDAARQVRALTGFDRVMVYRFDEDGSGEVVAESTRNGLPSFLGLRYPAADIPAQARRLYERNILRIIVDVDAVPAAITPALSPEGMPLDLSMSVLRSVSPIHLEYLRNMGVRSSMSISILRGGRLWGLIACHHGMPNHVGFQRRSVAELFGQMFSYLLEVRSREEERLHDEQARDIHHRIASAFAAPNASLTQVPEALAGMSGYIAADGIATYQGGEITLTGVTPTKEEFLQIVRFLNKTAAGRVYATHCLRDVFSPAADFVMRAAGLLSVPISRIPRDYLVFFRREVMRTVTWAGDPTKVATPGPNGIRLTPRKSFEAWQETVRDQSERWSPRDLRAAEALRVTLVELVLRIADTAEAERTGAVRRNELLIAELNHRVRNILGLVRGIISQSAQHTDDTKSLVDSVSDRIRSLARAFDLLSNTNWQPASLHDLLRTEIDAFDQSRARITMTGPDVMLQPKAFAAMALVSHELFTNARKYGALTVPSGQISIESTMGPDGNVGIFWREMGGPPVTVPERRGFGSTILAEVIPFEVDGISTPEFLPSGFTLAIELPAATAECVSAAPPPADASGVMGDVPDSGMLAQLLSVSLVVEDNLFIALDVEDMLRKLGATRVDIAKSVGEAIELINQRSYSFALLDVKLGMDNSLPVARALLPTDTRMVFGTGYGEAHSLDAALASVPIVSKPYHPKSLARVLARLPVASGHMAEK
ncbi:MAG TPA: HWE histidine kinase domain-containing protein [Acetobacteraceae bacterium]|nr:HWE histidine kinase domain-containing protein [Acetobacteraceae bacterium]